MRRTAPVFLIALLACGPVFYQAPPPLGTYPERVAAKRWQHLFRETSPPDPTLPDAAGLDDACRKLPQALATMAPEKRLAEIDRLLAGNRGGPYSARRANFLHELREVAAEPSLFEAANDYIAWRIDGDTPLPPKPPAEKPWDMDEEEFAARVRFYELQLKHRQDFLAERIGKAVPAMLPYWMVRRASFQFDAGAPAAAAGEFSAVIAQFPGHPRAEVAELMLARCRIEQSRTLRRAGPADGAEEEILGLLDEADSVLTDFIHRRPKGRFTPDAQGWLGATAFDRGRWGSAVRHQLARLERQPTREITRSVLRECDLVFGKLLESRDPAANDPWLDPVEQFDAAAVARHPLVARLFVQHCIDPAAHISLPMWWDDSENGGRGTIDFLKRRILSPQPFVRLALAGLGKELLKNESAPDGTTLTLLAWSATEDGEHEQALALLGRVRESGWSDEALLAKATVLQRLGRDADAVAVFDALAAAHPDSPLLDDQPYRKSVSLQRSGRTGGAILEILPLAIPKPVRPDTKPERERVNLHPENQLLQWLDTMIQFAPLEELESAFAGIKEDQRHRDLLRDAIRTRAIAARRFDLAARYLSDDAAAPPDDWEWAPSKLAKKRRMSRADWGVRVAPLARFYARLAENPPAGLRAGIHLDIARHWMAQRGTLTLPCVSLAFYAASEEEKQDLLRRRNALQLGIPRESIDRELDHRDEAAHALEHALEAAKSDDPAIAAPALELANQCLFRLAEFSLYQKSRALETGATGLSADIDRQLRSRFPGSPEAKRSVSFAFQPAAGPWMPGDYNPSNSANAMIGALYGFALDGLPDDSETLDKIGALVQRVDAIDPKSPLPAIRGELGEAKRELDDLRSLTHPDSQGAVIAAIDRLDDLSAAASLPGIRTADFIDYALGRHGNLPPAFQSLLDFRDRLKMLTDADGEDIGPKNDTIGGWREFLETWPDSPKAEAASFRLTRLIARQFRTGRLITAFAFPDAPVPNGYKCVSVSRMDPANDPEAVIAAIRDHEARFPAGRYRDDLNLLRAGAWIDAGKYPQALALLESVLANPAQRDLHVMAALEFADIAQRLLDPVQRGPVAKALRRTPGAIGRLRLLVGGDTFLSRLGPLMPWLEQG